MAEIREEAAEQLESHSETISLPEFVRIVEAHHRDEGPGVDRRSLAEYAEAVSFEVALEAIDDIRTESDAWESGKRLYVLENGNFSAYPPNWHETFSDADDVLDLVEIIYEEVTEPEGDMRKSVTEAGVPNVKVRRVGETVSTVDPEDIEDEFDALLDAGELEQPNPAERYAYVRPT